LEHIGRDYSLRDDAAVPALAKEKCDIVGLNRFPVIARRPLGVKEATVLDLSDFSIPLSIGHEKLVGVPGQEHDVHSAESNEVPIGPVS